MSFLQRNLFLLQLLGLVTLGALTTATLIVSGVALGRRIATEDLKASIPELSDEHRAAPLTDYGAARRKIMHPPNYTATKERAAKIATPLTDFGAARRKSVVHPLNYTAEEERTAKIAAKARRGEYDEELVLEQLARNRTFLTDEGLRKLRGSVVVVVGLGGVGSHAVSALARAGVARIRVVDFDQVTLSSLNRHALATLADVGTQKVLCVRKRLEQVVPWMRVDARGELMDRESQERLLEEWNFEEDEEGEGRKVDWVVDAIDNVDTKVELLRYCVARGLKVVSCMGAGCKSDPTRVMVGELSSTFEDPLSSATRRRLKILGVRDGVECVFSTEKPGEGKAQLQSLSEEEVKKGNVGDLAQLEGFRARILPVLGTMPAVFGYTAANHVICRIAGYPIEYRMGERGRDRMYEGMLSAFQGLIGRLVKKEGGESIGLRVPVLRDDVAYLVEEVFRGKSVVSGLGTRLALLPWEKPEGGWKAKINQEGKQRYVQVKLEELVLMTKEEAGRHEKEILSGDKKTEEFYSEDALATVNRRREEERQYAKYR